jgi:Flp pilus assembly protein TadG
MRALCKSLIERLRAFRLVEDGVAAVEFALILPMLFILYIGSVEASALISMDRRVQSVAGSLGDLVARSNKTLTSTTMTDYFRAARGMMTPYPAEGLRQVVTQVQVAADGSGAVVVWSKQYVDGVYSNGVTHTVNSAFDLDEKMREIAKGNYVIVSEVSLSYLPLYGLVIKQPISLYRENYFMPRFGGTITVN